MLTKASAQVPLTLTSSPDVERNIPAILNLMQNVDTGQWRDVLSGVVDVHLNRLHCQ